MKLRDNGQLVAGVAAKDMGDKTIGNDLDNAEISFSQAACWHTDEPPAIKMKENGAFWSRSGETSWASRAGLVAKGFLT